MRILYGFKGLALSGMRPWRIHVLRSRRLLCNCLNTLSRFLSPHFSFSRSEVSYSVLDGAMAGTARAWGCAKSVRIVFYILGVFYMVVVGFGIVVFRGCKGDVDAPSALVGLAAALRLLWMFGSGVAQAATASTILLHQSDNFVVDNAVRHQRRVTYKRWLWWSRFGILITILQVLGTMFIVIVILRKAAHEHISSFCNSGGDDHSDDWKDILVGLLILMSFVSTTLQCCAGSNVLKWRSFYAMHDGAWKAHYSEMFDHGIREVLCCLGRAKYLSVLEEDEVHSVAGLLGELVAYRAAGAGHLEFLAGIALLQRHGQTEPALEQYPEAPVDHIQEAVVLQPFAEAAYTGPLLDFGRNPIIFPCVWLYRQGVLTPWSRNRRPLLQGDNWWRGHAAAYLKFVNIPPEALRKGRVHQAKREASYFVVVAHHLQCVVIAVRGTETPEDLLTDGLCRECMLSEADLDGLLHSDILDNNVKQHVAATFPNYGHSGIVEAARELCIQLESNVESAGSRSSNNFIDHYVTQDSEKTGFLSSLLGPGGECHGYALRFVGHSLGGAIGAVAGMMLLRRFPNLHVYAYGVLPCVDATIADACSSFVTSIIYNNEFSARLSVTSVLRLRAAALAALAADSSTDSAMLAKLARRFLWANKCLSLKNNADVSGQLSSQQTVTTKDRKHKRKQKSLKYKLKGGTFLCVHATSCLMNMPSLSTTGPLKNPVKSNLHTQSGVDLMNVDAQIEGPLSLQNGNINDSDQQAYGLHAGAEIRDNDSYNDITILIEDTDTTNDSNERDIQDDFAHGLSHETETEVSTSNTMQEAPSSEPVELFVPGLVIHIVPEFRESWPSWKNWKLFQHQDVPHRAVLRHRESFRDMVVDPSMFLDHMPWRCHYALKKVLETVSSKGHLVNGRSDSFHSV